ncbi:hypothetical protein HanRHA438_Chr06g0250401 [Helianthus annuus]|nr:hypothetical protein HanRHA438_Chr06g0250401 [Helianthus annuus]
MQLVTWRRLNEGRFESRPSGREEKPSGAGCHCSGTVGGSTIIGFGYWFGSELGGVATHKSREASNSRRRRPGGGSCQSLLCGEYRFGRRG